VEYLDFRFRFSLSTRLFLLLTLKFNQYSSASRPDKYLQFAPVGTKDK